MIRRIRERGGESFRPVALDPIIKGAVPPRTNFRLTESGVSVIADDLISGIFTNLFSNAKKHGGPDVMIEVTTEMRGDRVIITVADDGPGIPDQDKRRLFERYTRLSTVSRGLGIGLFLCRTLASRYGGGIRVDNRIPGHPEKGSAFILTLRSSEMRDQL
nr:sensor histidine kinase [Methanocalculus chunghsingensis]